MDQVICCININGYSQKAGRFQEVYLDNRKRLSLIWGSVEAFSVAHGTYHLMSVVQQHRKQPPANIAGNTC